MSGQPRVTVTDVTDIEFDVMAQVRDATSTPSVLSELLSEPSVLRSIVRPSHRRARSSSSRRDGKQKEKDVDSSTVFSVVLAEEERQVNHLKAMLKSTADRLQYETRRADEAEHRAEQAATRAQEAQAKATQSDVARHRSEIEVARSAEELKRYKLQLDVAERELRRAQEELEQLAQQRNESELRAVKSRESARRSEQALRDYRSREEGREEGRRMGIQRGYDNGRSEGWAAGRTAGFKEGRVIGRKEGHEEGEDKGREYERRRALESFERFLENNAFDDHSIRERTQTWSESDPASPTNVEDATGPHSPSWIGRYANRLQSAGR